MLPNTARAKTSRDHALCLITSAERIFIAYSHADLRVARNLSRRIARLRPAKSADSVFLDQDSIAPGDSIQAEQVEQRLRASDLAVILCGRDTASSPTVNHEINIAIEANRTRGMIILPIILKPRVPLPASLDYSIQGIFLTNLFPAVLIVRWIIGSVVTILLAATLFFFVQQTKSGIDLFLKNDEATRVPADFGRRNQLGDVLRKAALIRYRDQEIRDLLSKTLTPDVARGVLTNTNIVALAVTCDGTILFTGSANRIDAYQTVDFQHTYSIELSNFQVTVRQTSTEYQTNSRECGELVQLVQDPAGVGVLAEIRYPGFANSNPCEAESSGESELLRLDGRSNALSLGMTRFLTWKNVTDSYGATLGGFYREDPDSSRSIWKLVKSNLYTINSNSTPETNSSIGSELEFLAFDSTGTKATLLAEHQNLGSSSEDPDAAAIYQKCAIVVEPSGNSLSTSHCEQWKWIVFPDGSEMRESEPSFHLAALHWPTRQAIIGGCYISFAGTNLSSERVRLPINEATNILFSANGNTLILQNLDQSISFLDLATRQITHKFLPPPRTKQMIFSGRADVVYILRDEGVVFAWQITAFGPDGWALRTERKPKAPTRLTGQ